MNKPIVWTIAGADSSGGAGIQADLKVFEYLGVHGCSVITAMTAQNLQHIADIRYTPPEFLEAQIAVLKELPASVIKIGMLGTIAAIEKLNYFVKNFSGQIVLDPVMVATSGKAMFVEDGVAYKSELIKLFPHIDMLTPNLPETETILSKKVRTPQDIEQAAQELLSLGVKNVLIKGGHGCHPVFSQDYWTNGTESCWLTSPRYPQKNYRGTGCTYASAIAANLALGYEMKEAIVIAKMYVNRGIRLAHTYQADAALIMHGGWPEEEIDFPYLSDHYIDQLPPRFMDCGPMPLGLYPIVNNSDWVEKLLGLGVTTIQLRIKDKSGMELEDEIKRSIQLAKQYHARLFINDYWELAIKYQAYGVHLGQEDLTTANIKKIHQAGLRLGISTHCYYEVARAHTFKPSYLACGPVFPTTSKVMKFSPQGIFNLSRWQRTLKNYRWVAIGGIDLEKLPAVLETGVDGIALISAITGADQPASITKQFLHMIGQYQCTN